MKFRNGISIAKISKQEDNRSLIIIGDWPLFSSPIGIQAIDRGSAWRVAGQQAPQGVDARVQALGKRLGSSTCRNQLRVESSRSFSPLRFLWWASLLVGARAQQTTPFPASMNLSSMTGVDGFVLNGEMPFEQSGCSVASAGDVNGDGIADLVIGAEAASPTGERSLAGVSYVVFGRAGLGSGGSFELQSLNGTNGFVLNGEQVNDYSGYSVASGGDVNGDEIVDLVIGAPGALNSISTAGKTYVVFGRAGLGSSGSLELSSLNGTTGFVLYGVQSCGHSGSSVASAGDVNGDRIADLVIGVPGSPPGINCSIAGKSYVVFGRIGLGGNGSLELSSLNGTNGFVLNGERLVI